MLGFKLCSSFQPVLLISNKKKIINYVPTLIRTSAQSWAKIQPYKPQKLLLDPMDQRAFSHYEFVVQAPSGSVKENLPTLLTAGDSILWGATYYKVIDFINYQQTHGIVKYECIQDFQNISNTAETNIDQPNGIALCDIIAE
jgi:hypothetical protein